MFCCPIYRTIDEKNGEKQRKNEILRDFASMSIFARLSKCSYRHYIYINQYTTHLIKLYYVGNSENIILYYKQKYTALL